MEDEKFTIPGSEIVPSISLNKHINSVNNYSLNNAINMRMSNDRAVIQNIEKLEDNEYIINFLNNNYENDFKIVWVLPCNNELILFVINKKLYNGSDFTNGKKCIELVRFDENTKQIGVVYSAITYYGGNYTGTYTYNNNNLIISFAEDNSNIGYITIRFDRFNIINIDEFKLYDNNEVLLPELSSAKIINGKFYGGYIDIYISYYINEIDKTPYYLLLNNYVLLETSYNTIDKYESFNIGFDINNNNEVIDKTLELFFNNLDYNYSYFSLGIIIHNKTKLKKYITKKISTSESIYTLLLENLYEEDFNINNIFIKNIKNIVSYNNRLYISNFIEENYKDILNYLKQNINDFIHISLSSKTNYIYDERYYQTFTNFKKFYFDDNLYIMRLLLSNNFSINAVNRYIYIEGYDVSSFIYPYDKLINLRSGDTLIYDIIENKCFLRGQMSLDVTEFLNNYLKIFIVGTFSYWVPGNDRIIRQFDLTSIYNNPNVNLNTIIPDDIMYGGNRVNYIIGGALRSNREFIIQGGSENGYYAGAISMVIGYKIGNGVEDKIYGISTHIGESDIYGKGISISTPNNFLYGESNILNSDYFNIYTYFYSSPNIYKFNFVDNILNVEDYYSIFIDTTLSQFYKNMSLRPLQIYNLFINLIDKFGNVTEGIKINNNTLLKNSDTTDDNNYTLVHIPNRLINNETVIDLTKGFYVVKENIKLNDATIKFYKVTNVYKVNDLLWKFDTDGTYITNPFDETFNSTCLSIGLFSITNGDVDYNDFGCGRYINKYNETFFVIPPFIPASVILLKANINYNYIDRNIFKNYYITCSKPCNNISEQSIGRLYNQNKAEQYKTSLQFIYDHIYNLKAILPFTYALETYSNSESTFESIMSNADSTISKIDKINLCLAGEGKTYRINRITNVTFNGFNLSELDDNGMSVFRTIAKIPNHIILFNFRDDYYANNENSIELHMIGEICKLEDNDNFIGGDSIAYKKNFLIYDEKGFVWSTSENKAVTEINGTETAEVYGRTINTIDNSGMASLYIKNNPYVGNKTVYVEPINTLDLYDSSLSSYHDSIIVPFYSLNKLQLTDVKNNTILFSDVLSDESLSLKWKNIGIESYKIINSTKGDIVNLFVLGINMFIHCRQALYLLQFKDYIATTEESLQITQSSIKDISYKELLPTDKGYCGLQDKKATIIGNFGYIFYENDTNRLFRLDNEQLIYMDYPIVQWLQKYRPYEVRFANDVERSNLIIQFKYKIQNTTKIFILLYDYIINSFVSCLNNNIFWFTEAYNTKNKLYLLQNSITNSTIKCFNDYKFEKNIFRILNQDGNLIDLTNKISFIYNLNYNAIKYLEYIQFKLFKYIKKEEREGTITDNIIDFTNDPIETIRIPFCGDYIRIYNENVDTGWIEIKNGQDKDTYNSKDDYTMPHYNLGVWSMNLFRNIINKKLEEQYSEITSKDYINADDRTRLYGNYFIIEFGFNLNDNKYTGEQSDKFEIQSLKINIIQN